MAVVASQFTSAVESGTLDVLGLTQDIDPGVEQTVTYTVPASKIWRILSVVVESPVYGEFDIFKNLTKIGSGNTSPLESNINFIFSLPYVTSTADEIVVKFTSSANSPIGARVGIWIQRAELDA